MRNDFAPTESVSRDAYPPLPAELSAGALGAGEVAEKEACGGLGKSDRALSCEPVTSPVALLGYGEEKRDA